MALTTLTNLLAESKAFAIKLEEALGILGPLVEVVDPSAAPIVEGVEAVAEAVEGATTETTSSTTPAV